MHFQRIKTEILRKLVSHMKLALSQKNELLRREFRASTSLRNLLYLRKKTRVQNIFGDCFWESWFDYIIPKGLGFSL